MNFSQFLNSAQSKQNTFQWIIYIFIRRYCVCIPAFMYIQTDTARAPWEVIMVSRADIYTESSSLYSQVRRAVLRARAVARLLMAGDRDDLNTFFFICIYTRISRCAACIRLVYMKYRTCACDSIDKYLAKCKYILEVSAHIPDACDVYKIFIYIKVYIKQARV